MPRLPRGFHSPAAGRGGNFLNWRPGYRGSGMMPIVPVPITRYQQYIRQVPLTGGQAQGVMTLQAPATGQLMDATGAVITDTAGLVITDTTASAAGTTAGAVLQVGPQGLGTIWYPTQITLSTTIGALDTCTVSVYLGPLIAPTTLVGQIFSGNGTVALAIPSMSPGQSLIAVWTNGTAGEGVAMNVIGTMDALTTRRQ